SLLKCCEKRPVTLEDIEKVLDNILSDLKKVETSPLNTSDVGSIVLKNLKDLDEIAFLRYAIVHNNYDSMGEFMNEIGDLSSFKGIDYKKK
ncbi:MAG: hypothetical protein KC550_01445, partial [Nanoarchaeota archaeon]|nr:hypothetical protein [Nanoarchaeota archaeon]